MTITSTTLVANLNANYVGGVAVANLARTGGQLITLSGNTVGAATATFTATNKPGSNSGNEWLTVNIGGTNYYVPIWA